MGALPGLSSGDIPHQHSSEVVAREPRRGRCHGHRTDLDGLCCRSLPAVDVLALPSLQESLCIFGMARMERFLDARMPSLWVTQMGRRHDGSASNRGYLAARFYRPPSVA